MSAFAGLVRENVHSEGAPPLVCFAAFGSEGCERFSGSPPGVVESSRRHGVATWTPRFLPAFLRLCVLYSSLLLNAEAQRRRMYLNLYRRLFSLEEL